MISLYRDMAYNNILQVPSIKSISFHNMPSDTCTVGILFTVIEMGK